MTVEEQTRAIDECIIKYKATLMTLETYRYQYDSKEYYQKTEIVKGFIELLQALKIK